MSCRRIEARNAPKRKPPQLIQAALRVWLLGFGGLGFSAEVGTTCKGPPELEKAISTQPSASAYDIGLIYCRSGDLKAGRAELLEAQKLNAQDPEIEQALRFLENADPA